MTAPTEDPDVLQVSGAARKNTGHSSPVAPVALLGAASFAVTADTRVVTPLLPIIAHQFHTNIGAAGSLVTAYALPYGLFQILYGPLGDRVGKLRVMVWAMACFAFGTAGCAFAPSLAGLDALRFITGAAAAALIPLSLAYIGDHVPYANRQAAIAQLLGAIALGSILSTSLGGIVADVLSWRYIFLVYGVVSIAVTGLLWRASRRAPYEAANAEARRVSLAAMFAGSLREYRTLLRQGESRAVLIGVFVEGLFFFGGFAYLGAFLRQQFNLLYLVIGLLLAVYGIGNLFYARTARRFIWELGERGQILLGGALLGVTFVVIAYVPNLVVFTLMILIIGIAYNLLHSTLQTKATELAPHARGAALSLFAFCLFVGQGIGAWGLGMVVNRGGYTPTFLLTGLPLTALAVYLVRRLPLAGRHDSSALNEEQPLVIME